MRFLLYDTGNEFVKEIMEQWVNKGVTHYEGEAGIFRVAKRAYTLAKVYLPCKPSLHVGRDAIRVNCGGILLLEMIR